MLQATAIFLLCALPLAAQTNVLTYKNNNARTGANTTETVLTQQNVNANSFGKLWFFATDGWVDAQPLYVSNLTIPGQGTHNVLYVATENDTLYALDANTAAVIWILGLMRLERSWASRTKRVIWSMLYS